MNKALWILVTVWMWSLMMLSSFAQADVNLTSGLYAYWGFDVNSSTQPDNMSNSPATTNATFSTTKLLGAGSLFYSGSTSTQLNASCLAGTGAGKVYSVNLWYYNGTNNWAVIPTLFKMGAYSGASNGMIGGFYNATHYIMDGYSMQSFAPRDNANHWVMLTFIATGTRGLIYVNATLSQNFSFNPTLAAGESVLGRSSTALGRWYTGYIDEVAYYQSKILNQSEIDTLYNNGTGLAYPFNSSSSPALGNLSVISEYPSVNRQYNYTTPIYFNITINSTTNSTNTYCNLSVSNGAITNIYSSNQTGNGTLSYNQTLTLDWGGNFPYIDSWYCYNQFSNVSSVGAWTYIDIVLPTIASNFINQSLFYKDNFTAQFNLSDDFWLSSFNLTIDGTQIAGNNTINAQTYQYNLSYNASSLNWGTHNLSVRLADGHTAQEIQSYKVSKGIFSDYLKYTWDDDHSAKIYNKNFNLFDNFDTEKQIDRYTFNFKPAQLTDSYTFRVETTDPIYIMNNPNSEYKKWLVFGDKWLDFNLDNENEDVDINQIDDYTVDVTISNIQNPEIQQYQSIGDLNIVYQTYIFYKLNATESHNPIVYEGSMIQYLLYLNTSYLNTTNRSAYLMFNNAIQYNGTESVLNENASIFSVSFTAPTLNQSVINSTWFFNVSNTFNNITFNQSYFNFNITNCGAGNYVILNYSLVDQDNLTGINGTIETDMNISSISNSSLSWKFNITANSTSSLAICLSNNTLSLSNYTLYSTTRYSSSGKTVQYHFLQNFTLTSSNIPNNIILRDLLSSESTSFLINYQDDFYLPVQGAIIDILRYYIGLGSFLSVEHGLTDAGGQANGHLITESTIYMFNVWKNGVLLYSSPQYKALCQATPCQINLRPTINTTYSQISNLIYTFTSDAIFQTTKNIVLMFSTTDGSSTNISMSTFNNLNNATICSSSILTSSGSLNCSIPTSYTNSTYTVIVMRDGSFLGYKVYSLNKPTQIFGSQSMILTALTFLTLAFMGITSGTAAIIFGIVGLVMASLLSIFSGGSVIGVGSTIIWLIVAAGIIIWKINKRRVQ